jgi:hypothetical protein
MPNLSLRCFKTIPRLPSAVFGVKLLCLPLRYARLRLHVEDGRGDGVTGEGVSGWRLTMG